MVKNLLLLKAASSNKIDWFPCFRNKMLKGGGWVVIGGKKREREREERDMHELEKGRTEVFAIY